MQGLEELDKQFRGVLRQLLIWRPVSRVHPPLRPAQQPLSPAAAAPQHGQDGALQKSACPRGTAGGLHMVHATPIQRAGSAHLLSDHRDPVAPDARPSGVAAGADMVHAAPAHRAGSAHLNLDRHCNLSADLHCDVACWPPGSSASAALGH